MAVKIGHASIDERGSAHGGAAGDQTGKEVYIRDWYNGNWSVLLRPKSAAIADKMVTFVKDVCTGNMVGYDQWQRNTLRDEARKAGWNGKAIATKCETDCSAFMTVAAEAAGVNMDVAYTALGNGQYNAPVTQTMRKAFTQTGQFEALTASKYLTGTNCLRRGDILVRESGHTCMVLDSGPNADPFPVTVTKSTPEQVSGTYRVATQTDPLNVRSTPGGDIIGKLPKDERVKATQKDEGWLYVIGDAISGWASADYLEKVEEEPEVDFSKLSDKDCYHILEKAQKYAAKLDGSEWAWPEFEQAQASGITDGSSPRAFATREEVAVMIHRAVTK